MKLNLRKIIKEEIGGFDWVSEHNPTFISNEDKIRWNNKMVSYLSLGGNQGRVLSNEWATFNAFLIELTDLGETELVNWLMLKTLPQDVSRPYPYILEGIKEFRFDVNKSQETKRLYDKFYKSQPILKRWKNKIFGESISEIIKEEINDFNWIDSPEEQGVETGRSQARPWVVKMIDGLNNLYKDMGYSIRPAKSSVYGELNTYEIVDDQGRNYTIINPYQGWDSVLYRLKRDYNEILNIVGDENDSLVKTAKELYTRAVKYYNSINESVITEANIKVGKDEYDKLFEDKTILVLKPKTHQASCKYGAGTKWCVTMRHTDQYWKNYTKKTSNFAGSNWYKVVGEVEEEVSQSLWDKLKGKKPEKVKKEVQEFIEEFPVGILYFVIVKKRITGYNWNEELRYNEPIYQDADPKDPMNKLALLYQPNRADFGDMSWWKENSYDFYNYIGYKLDAAHNNMSIFNALDQKVTLRQINSTLGRQFAVAFNFIEEDFQKERDAINTILKNVLHKLKPLAGGEGSDNPQTWMTAQSGDLVYSDTKNMVKNKDGGVTMKNAKGYRNGHW